MCGIAGIMSVTGRPVMEEELRAMCAAMIARGPDDEGVYLARPIGLAMRRLSIIDLHTGHQPVCNEDRTVWVVLNGEIYNVLGWSTRVLCSPLVDTTPYVRIDGRTHPIADVLVFSTFMDEKVPDVTHSFASDIAVRAHIPVIVPGQETPLCTQRCST